MINNHDAAEFVDTITRARAELENLHGQIKGAIELVAAVNDCIESAPNDPQCYSEALFGAVQYLRSINDELAEIVRGMFGKEAGA